MTPGCTFTILPHPEHAGLTLVLQPPEAGAVPEGFFLTDDTAQDLIQALVEVVW